MEYEFPLLINSFDPCSFSATKPILFGSAWIDFWARPLLKMLASIHLFPLPSPSYSVNYTLKMS